MTPFQRRIAQVWGGLDEIMRAADDPDAAAAAFFQVTPDQLRAWRAAGGRQRCPAVTTRGRGCLKQVSAKTDYDPRAWLSRTVEPCPAHATTPGPDDPPAGKAAGPGDHRASRDDADSLAR